MKPAVLLLLLCSACAHGLRAPTASPVVTPTWRTMQAEQSVALAVTRADGGVERRAMRAVLAVARPDRFRLRALGPGGLTLFDLLYVGGQVKVLGGILPKHDAFAAVVQSVAGDLAAAYALVPANARTTALVGDSVVVREPGRVVRLENFRRVDGQAIPTLIEVEGQAHAYRVRVEVVSAALDSALDPALFTE